MREEIQKELENKVAFLKDLEVVKQHSYLGKELDDIEKRARDNIFKLAVVGEFSSGKSTFINAIIGRDLLSHAVDETTAVITYIYNVDAADKRCGTCRVNYMDGRTEVLSDYSKFAEYSTTHSSLSVVDVIKSIDVFVDFLHVKIPLVIVDTPGLNGVADKHKEITIQEVKKAHACMYLLSVKGLTDSDISFIKVLTAYQSFFIFIQNFIDTLKITEGETPKTKMEKADEIIRKAFDGYQNFEYEICAISALQALVSKDKTIEKLYAEDEETLSDSQRNILFKESGFQNFERILVDCMESGKYRKAVIGSTVQAVQSIIASLLPGLYIQKEDNEELMKSDSKSLMIQKATTKLQQIEEKSGINRKKLKNFIVSRDKENRVELKKGIEQDLENVYAKVAERIDKEMSDFIENRKQEAGKYFSDIVLADTNEKIIPNLNEDIKTGFQVVYSDALLRAEKYLGRMTGSKKIVIDSPDVEVNDSLNKRGATKREEIDRMKVQLWEEEDVKQKALKNKLGEIQESREQAEDDIKQENRNYSREKENYESRKSLLGSKPVVIEKRIKREREVKKRFLIFFHRTTTETYYETVRDDSALKRWEQDRKKLDDEILSKQKR